MWEWFSGLHAAILVTFAWCVVLPFVWAQNLALRLDAEYFALLRLYVPELLIATMAVVLLPAAWSERPWAAKGLFLAALAAPVLQLSIGSPTHGAWVLSSLLLALVGWRLHPHVSRPAA